MREKMKPGRKKGSVTVGEKWEAKQKKVDDYYVNKCGGYLAEGEHMVDPTEASRTIKREFETAPSPSDIVERYLNGTAGKTTDRKGRNVTDQTSSEIVPVLEDTRDGSLHNASVNSYELFDRNHVKFWVPESEVLPMQERYLKRAGKKRLKNFPSKVNAGTLQE